MVELTDEQVDRAAKEFWLSPKWGYGTPGEGVGENAKVGLRAAAPFLQLPWDEPTEDEAHVIHSTNLGLGLTSSFDRNVFEVLCRFVRRRNAALLPKPVDPRREAVMNVLRQSVGVVDSYSNGPECVADRILDAIDGIK